MGITFREESGHEVTVTPEMTSSWLETELPTVLTNYALGDNFNDDKFGLFFKAPPTKSLHWKGEGCCAGKHSKLESQVWQLQVPLEKSC